MLREQQSSATFETSNIYNKNDVNLQCNGIHIAMKS